MKAAKGGPYLQAALLCERALREHDNVLSVIRIIDRWHVKTPQRDESDPPFEFPLQCTAVITFKSGDFSGKKLLNLCLTDPEGTTSNVAGTPILFEGGDRGHNVIMNLSLAIKHEGLYWIDVSLDDELQTRIPFRIILDYVVSSSTAAQESH